MSKIYELSEHNLVVSGEKQDLCYLAEVLRDAEGTVGDLRYKIEYAFDIDGIRSSNSEDEECNAPNYADRYLKQIVVCDNRELKKKTPAGTLIARYKQDESYPGFYVNLHKDGPVCTVEYEPTKGCIQVVVYADSGSDEPSHIIPIPAKEVA